MSETSEFLQAATAVFKAVDRPYNWDDPLAYQPGDLLVVHRYVPIRGRTVNLSTTRFF